jgi:hypothetical protein
MFHSRGVGKPELSPSLKAESCSLGDPSRMACIDGDPLRAVPMNTAPKSLPLGDRRWSSKWSAMNLRSSKRMALSWVSSVPNGWPSPMETVGLGKVNHQNF